MPSRSYLARVHRGRLLLDEPTDLPEGDFVELVEDDLDPELVAEIDASLAELDAGRELRDAAGFMADLRSRR